jgi:tetratricopeptide (TPR) repeat protein
VGVRSRPGLRPALAALLGAALAHGAGVARADEPAPQAAVSWATSQATEMTRQGREHATRGDGLTAAKRYLDAIGFDPTYGPAYLALGGQHEAGGDPREAERAYSMGIDHVPGFAEALLARGRLRARLGRADEAVGDFEAAAAVAPEGIAILKALAGAYVAQKALPAALAVTRRMETMAEAQGDTRAAAEARVGVRALATLVGEVDPVSAGKSGRGVVRRAIWLLASRRR